MNKENDFVYLVTVLEVLSPWCLAGCNSMQNKSYKIYKKVLLLIHILESVPIFIFFLLLRHPVNMFIFLPPVLSIKTDDKANSFIHQ